MQSSILFLQLLLTPQGHKIALTNEQQKCADTQKYGVSHFFAYKNPELIIKQLKVDKIEAQLHSLSRYIMYIYLMYARQTLQL